MPVRVRVQNFQSIEDAEVVIDGLTVITGPNNSGKSAFMRAIWGVFTNAPSGPLVRRGESHLTVDIEFGDGHSVRWEKGPKINQYTVDGKKLSNVGRGVPPEVAELGVQEIKGGSDRLWPQIARQFDGTLFLVNRSGSAVAEALSDIKRVGRLSEALRLSDSDKRSTVAELKIRRKDLITFTEEAEAFDGLAGVETLAAEVDSLLQEAQTKAAEITTLEMLTLQRTASETTVKELTDFDPDVVPPPSTVASLMVAGRNLGETGALQERHKAVLCVAKSMEGFDASCVPVLSPVLQEHRTTLKEAQRLSEDLESRVRQLEHLKEILEALPDLPDTTRGEKLRKAVTLFADFQDRRDTANGILSGLEEERTSINEEYQRAQDEVAHLLGSMGECPTCGTVHEGSSS